VSNHIAEAALCLNVPLTYSLGISFLLGTKNSNSHFKKIDIQKDVPDFPLENKGIFHFL